MIVKEKSLYACTISMTYFELSALSDMINDDRLQVIPIYNSIQQSILAIMDNVNNFEYTDGVKNNDGIS